MLTYKWEYESIDADGDVIDFSQADRLQDFTASQRTDSCVQKAASTAAE